ncbi:MAG: hypothetical protein QOF53_1224 [Nocardioidaceae bacterium]|jgi:hypothetical protein|nr:hypothetical protein [Nocardioidaceae bacterium]
MQTIQDTVDIPASTAAVWRVLTATRHCGAWNPFIRRLEGDLRPGGRLRLTISPLGRSMTFTAWVLAVEDEHLLRWRGRLGVPGLLDGEHEFRLLPLPDGGTRFASMNQAIKQRAVTASPPATS